MRRELMGYLVKGFGGDVLLVQRCWCKHIFHVHKNGRYPSRAQKRNQRFLFRTVGHREDFTEPSRYGSIHEHLQLYKRNNYIYVNEIIYVYIRTHRWLYVVITTKVRYFLVRYFINAALLVIIHIPRTQKWAPGHTVPAVIDAIVRWYVSNRFDEITNSFDYQYTNGPLDGFHTKIKTLKEIHLD